MAIAVVSLITGISLVVGIIDPFGLSPISISIPGVDTMKVGRNSNDRVRDVGKM